MSIVDAIPEGLTPSSGNAGGDALLVEMKRTCVYTCVCIHVCTRVYMCVCVCVFCRHCYTTAGHASDDGRLADATNADESSARCWWATGRHIATTCLGGSGHARHGSRHAHAPHAHDDARYGM